MDQINPRFLKSSKPSVPSYIKEQDQKLNQALNKYKQNLSSKPFPPDDVNEEEEDGDKDQEQHCRPVVTLICQKKRSNSLKTRFEKQKRTRHLNRGR
jgi:hypothetical protein